MSINAFDFSLKRDKISTIHKVILINMYHYESILYNKNPILGIFILISFKLLLNCSQYI